MVHDITERRRAEDALRQNEQKLRGIVEQSPDGVTVTDEQGRIITWNQAMERITGLKASDVVGKLSWDIQFQQAPEERKTSERHRQIKEMTTEVLRTGQAPWLGQLTDTKYQHPDGTHRFVQSVTFSIQTNQGFMLGSVVRDTTEHRRAEEIVRLRLRLWEYAATHSVDELMQKALNEIDELTNSAIGFYHFVEEDQNTLSLQAWSTRTQEEFCKAEGKGLHYSIDEAGVWVDCVHERKPVIHNDYASLSHRKGMPDGHAEIVRELVVPTMRDGRVVSILGVGNKPTDYHEQDIEFVAYVADVVWEIVERRRTEEAIRRSNAELQARNEELDAFGHTVAHDLKNPLNNIIGFSYVLADDENPPSDEEAFQMAQIIQKLGFKMDNIIEELMLLAGLRRAEVHMEPLAMDKIVADVMRRLDAMLEESQAKIIGPENWPTAVGHEPWVEEVWINYISNAVKYGGQPPLIELGVAEENGNMRFWVRDNGPGLTDEEQARLFVPFERLDQTHLSGYGLGLSIVQRIVERMGGKARVESTGVAGEGSTFSFTLPAVQQGLQKEGQRMEQVS
jgi:PAS domain S-box-containing protein